MQQPLDFNSPVRSTALPVTAKGHPAAMWYLSAARMLERFGYYGMRSVIMLYMVQSLGYDKAYASAVYGMFTASMYLTPVIGGLLGDFAIKRKYMMIAGGFAEMLGILLMIIPVPGTLFAGLVLLALGSGFYAPNMLAGLGEAYGNRKHLADAGFLILYCAINIGAFMAPLICGGLGESLGYPVAFFIAAAGMGIGQVFIFIYKPASHAKSTSSGSPYAWLSAPILIACLVFWTVYGITEEPVTSMVFNARVPFSPSFLMSVNGIAIMILSVISAVAWSYLKINPLLKIAIGFIVLTLLLFMVLLLKIPEGTSYTVSAGMPVTLMILQALSEILVIPILLSAIAQYVNVKYLSTFMSISVCVPGLLYIISAQLYPRIFGIQSPLLLVMFGFAAIIFSVLFTVLYFVTREKNTLRS